MARLKVLPLPSYVKLMVERGDLVPDSNAVLHRNGFYLKDMACWLEYEGKLYLRDKDDFLYELRLLNSAIYTKTQYEMLCTLRKQKILSKEMLASLATFEMWYEAYGLPSMLRAQKINARFRAFLKSKGMKLKNGQVVKGKS